MLSDLCSWFEAIALHFLSSCFAEQRVMKSEVSVRKLVEKRRS